MVCYGVWWCRVPLVLVVGVAVDGRAVEAEADGVLARGAQRDGDAAARRELAAAAVRARYQLVLARAPRAVRLHRAPALPDTSRTLHPTDTPPTIYYQLPSVIKGAEWNLSTT